MYFRSRLYYLLAALLGRHILIVDHLRRSKIETLFFKFLPGLAPTSGIPEFITTKSSLDSSTQI